MMYHIYSQLYVYKNSITCGKDIVSVLKKSKRGIFIPEILLNNATANLSTVTRRRIISFTKVKTLIFARLVYYCSWNMSVRSKVVTIVENDKHDYKKTKKERKFRFEETKQKISLGAICSNMWPRCLAIYPFLGLINCFYASNSECLW